MLDLNRSVANRKTFHLAPKSLNSVLVFLCRMCHQRSFLLRTFLSDSTTKKVIFVIIMFGVHQKEGLACSGGFSKCVCVCDFMSNFNNVIMSCMRVGISVWAWNLIEKVEWNVTVGVFLRSTLARSSNFHFLLIVNAWVHSKIALKGKKVK